MAGMPAKLDDVSTCSQIYTFQDGSVRVGLLHSPGFTILFIEPTIHRSL